MTVHGCDTSKYQTPINAVTGWSRGLRFAALRVSIGDYYTDPTLRLHWDLYKAAGFLVTGYMVVAPADSYGRKISAAAHLSRFAHSVVGLKPDLPWVMDSELERGQTRQYITSITKDVALGLNTMQGRMPICYTRQSWWDAWINPDPLWPQLDLWAARYAEGLTGPWSDGNYVFRDWDKWTLWQYTSHGNGPFYGVTSLDLDLDWFNGTEADLYAYAGQIAPISLEQKVATLWREAKIHGWNLEP